MPTNGGSKALMKFLWLSEGLTKGIENTLCSVLAIDAVIQALVVKDDHSGLELSGLDLIKS